ncbi:MAG: YdbH domain-containing protein [Desulfamplus sp.]|nr:YdbH domain-containing protein [Desulfamplus sp.]
MVRAILKISLFIFAIASILIFILLPHVISPIAQRLILEKTASIEALKNFKLDVQNIGISGVGIGKITTGESISVDSLFCYYSIKSLMKKKVDRLAISGLEINGDIEGNSFVLKDFPTKNSKPTEDSQKEKQENNLIDNLAILEFLPPVIEINHSFLTIKNSSSNNTLTVPFSLICTVQNSNLNSSSTAINLSITPIIFGQEAKISITAEIRDTIESLVVNIHNISWSAINQLVSIFIPKSDIKLVGSSDIIVSMQGDLLKWRATLSHIGIKEPIQSEINNMVLNLNINSPQIRADGSFWFANPNISPVNVTYNFNSQSDKKWAVKIKGKEMWQEKPFIVGSGKQLFRAIAPDFQIDCSSNGDSLEGELKGSVGGLVYDSQGIKLDKIDCNLPFKYIDKSKKFSLDGKLNFDGLATLPIKADAQISQNGTIKAGFGYKLNSITVTPDLIKRVYQGKDGQKDELFSDIDFSFNILSEGNFSLYDGNITSSINLDLNSGRLSIPEKKIDISGIKSALSFKGYPDIKPLSGLILRADRVDIKDLKISNAAIRYSIESTPNSSPSLLIENALFDWCDGKVISESIRIPSKNGDYNISLFCDRLKLSSLLKQVGNFEAEGDGTLNGRIPISILGGNITFNNGFLYSTPGKGGNIKVSDSDKLTAGIAKDTPQFNQLDLAKEALKNYRYEWARFGFNTKGEELLVKMEFDGKPQNTLPFVYKKELGSFIRVSADKSGSNFQGIKIDVNLQLPFNRVLKFGNKINKKVKF